MKKRLDRRSFLQGLVVTIAATAPACGDDSETASSSGSGGGGSTSGSTSTTTASTGGTGGEGGAGPNPADQERVYPQGIASGDPAPDAVILWTRIEPEDESGPFDVLVEVSPSDDFADIVASQTVPAEEDYDHTIRVRVTGLSAFTVYYYRFTARGVVSITGRTKTAPENDQDVAVRFAFASCQDYVGRYYHSWKALAEEDPVDFVLYLGDYIYETNGDPLFQETAPGRLIEIEDGIVINEETDPPVKAASTLRDYRGIYKQIKSDPDLRRVHALYPFICIWDDHEFANDCWSDHSTDFDDAQGDEKNPERRHAASQAWSEFQPANVTFDPDAAPPNDLQIYRSLRYGRHVELFLTDQRSYRDDHAIPEGADPDAKPEGAGDDVPTYGATGAGTFENSEIFTRTFVKKDGFDPIEAYVQPSILGEEQKEWLIDGITNSTATWKVWGNEVQLAQMLLDLREFAIPESFRGIYYFTCDQWDGYRSERREILEALEGTPNIVAVTGDIHAFYAAEIWVDPDTREGDPVLVEYTTAGISSSPAQEITQGVVDSSPAFTALADLVPQFDEILLESSAEYRHANSLAHGIAIADVSEGAFEVSFLEIPDVKEEEWDGTVNRTRFRTEAGTASVEEI
jgi:alkaline phosphatase D